MPIYKGKDITIEEWYEINPAARPKPQKTQEELQLESEQRRDDGRHDAIEEFADAMCIPSLICSAADGDEEAQDLVLAFRACADHIKAMMIHDRCNYYGETDDRFIPMEEETCDNRLKIPGASDDPHTC
jgi:hypothetical protein